MKKAIVTLQALIAAAVLGGCLAPVQYQGDIPIDTAGFSERLDTLCRWEVGEGSRGEACAEHGPTAKLEVR